MSGSGGFRTASGRPPEFGLRALWREAQDAKERALDAMAVAVVRQVQLELSTPGRGRVYRRRAWAGKGKRLARAAFDARVDRLRGTVSGRFLRRKAAMHVASAPGDPPAVDTGNLRGSISWERVRQGRRVGTNAEYADLEFGIRNAGRSRTVHIAPRPYFRPAIRKVEGTLGVILVGALRRAGAQATDARLGGTR